MKYPTVANLSCTAQLKKVPSKCIEDCMDVKLDLRYLAQRMINVEYNPRRFSALMMRTRAPRCSVLLFTTGQIVVSGCRSIPDCLRALRQTAQRVSKILRMECAYYNFKIQNCFANADFGARIDLNKLKSANMERTTYEPEIFAGLSIRWPDRAQKLTAIVFGSGKVNITGANSFDQVSQVFREIQPLIRAAQEMESIRESQE